MIALEAVSVAVGIFLGIFGGVFVVALCLAASPEPPDPHDPESWFR